MAAAQFPLFVVLKAIDQVTGPLNKATKGVRAAGATMQKIGGALTAAITLPVIGFGLSSLRAGGEFETMMRRVGIATDSLGTPKLKELEQQAKSLGRTSIFTATQVAEAQRELGLAGLDVNAILGATPAVVNLAAAESMELARAAEIAANTMSVLGARGDQVGEITDKLSASASASTSSVESLAEGMKYVLPVSLALGQSLEGTLAMLSTLAQGGIQGEASGTGARGILLELATLSPAAERAMRDLGLTAADLRKPSGELREMVELVELLVAHGITSDHVFRIFSRNAGTAFLSLVKVGTHFQRGVLDQVATSTGKVSRDAANNLSAWHRATTDLSGAWEKFQLKVAEGPLLGWVTKAMGFAAKFLDWLGKLPPKWVAIGTVVLAVIAVVGPIVLLLGLLISSVAGVIAAFTAAAPVLAAVLPVLLAVISVITALIAVTFAVIVWWDELASFFGSIWGGIVDGWNAIVGAVQSAIAAVSDGIKSLLDLMPDWLVRMMTAGAPGLGILASLGPSGPPAALAGPLVSPAPVSQTKVRVEFDNLPAGARVTTESDDDLETHVGRSMGGS